VGGTNPPSKWEYTMKKRTHEDLIGNPEACQRDLIRGLSKLYVELLYAHPGVWRSPTLHDLRVVIDNLQDHFEKGSYPHIAVWWQPPIPGIDTGEYSSDKLDFD
jgi:hypothetical protein